MHELPWNTLWSIGAHNCALESGLSFLFSPSEFSAFFFFLLVPNFGLINSISHGEHSSAAHLASTSIPFGKADDLQVPVFCTGALGLCWQSSSISLWFLRAEIHHGLSSQDSSGLPPPHRGQDIPNTTQSHKLCFALAACMWHLILPKVTSVLVSDFP